MLAGDRHSHFQLFILSNQPRLGWSRNQQRRSRSRSRSRSTSCRILLYLSEYSLVILLTAIPIPIGVCGCRCIDPSNFEVNNLRAWFFILHPQISPVPPPSTEVFSLQSRWPNLFVPRYLARHSRSLAGQSAFRNFLSTVADNASGIPICSRWEWAPLDWSGKSAVKQLWRCLANDTTSSAKDQLTGQAVAVKKIMKPFSTPVLSKRTYRELKLLKHLRHENVRENLIYDKVTHWTSKGHQFKRHLYFTSWGYVNRPWYRVMLNAKFSNF